MPIMKKISKNDTREIRDHRDNTSKELIKCYTLAQISLMDWIDTRTVKNSPKYLPVRVDSSRWLYRLKRWETTKAYTVKYIRLDEIKYIFNKRTWKKLTIDL